MTLRGLLSAVLVAAGLTAPVSPAAAKQAEFTTYEISRTMPGGSGIATAHITGKTAGTAVVSYLHLAREGRGYRPKSIGILISGYDGTHRTYGWPVPPPACPPGVCGSRSVPGQVTHHPAFTMKNGDRLLVAAPRGVSVKTANVYWRTRAVAPAFTVVRATGADATGASNVLGTGVEHFREATAPGGRYGSSAFALVPCAGYGAGVATVRAGSETVDQITCPFSDSTFAQTSGSGGWTVSGDVVGTYDWPIRLATFAYPKP